MYDFVYLPTTRQLIRHQRGLLQHGFSGEFFYIRRIVILPQYPLDNHAQLGLYTFLQRPVNGCVLAHPFCQHHGQFTQLALLHELAGAFVVGDGGVEGVFEGAQAHFFRFMIHALDVFGKLDQFFDDFGRGRALL